jgi:hypothetical protein
MKNDLDIEDVLKKYEHKPDSRVKQTVLARFADRTRTRLKPDMRGLWCRPVPLYLVAAQLVIAIGLGFFAARFLPVSNIGSEAGRDKPVQIEAGEQSRDAFAAEELTWEVAPNDLL